MEGVKSGVGQIWSGREGGSWTVCVCVFKARRGREVKGKVSKDHCGLLTPSETNLRRAEHIFHVSRELQSIVVPHLN